MNARVRLGCALLFLCTTAIAAGTETIGMLRSPIRVPVGKVSTPITVFVFASGEELLKKEEKAKEAKFTDLSGAADGIKVTFDNVDVVGVSRTTTTAGPVPSQIEWRTDLKIEGAMPVGKTLTREAQIVLDGAMRHFTYELTSKVAAVTWTLNQPVAAVAVADAAVTIPFSITAAGEGQSTTARITRTTIRDAANRVASIGALTLDPAEVTMGTPSSLQLKVDGTKIPAGNYTGSVEVALVGAADPKTFDLSIASSPPRSRLIGFFCVFAGVIVAMLLAGVLRNYAAYLAARLPASRMTDLLREEQNRLEAAVPATDTLETHKWIAEVETNLDVATLRDKGFLPRLLPAAFGGGNVDTAGYTQYLQTQGEAIGKISDLIERGFLRVDRYAADPVAEAQAYTALDAIAFDRPADVKGAAEAIIAALHAQSKMKGPLTADTTTLTQHVLLRSDFVNGTAWILFAVIATATGYLAAVDVAGFGLMSDYFRAFLWGLGLQAAGTQLQQLTPSSIASTIGITMPKAS